MISHLLKATKILLQTNRLTAVAWTRGRLRLKLDIHLLGTRLQCGDSQFQGVSIHGFRVQRARYQLECPFRYNNGPNFRSGGESHFMLFLVAHHARQKVLRKLVSGIASASEFHAEKRIGMLFPGWQSAVLAESLSFSQGPGAQGVVSYVTKATGVPFLHVVVEHSVLEEAS